MAPIEREPRRSKRELGRRLAAAHYLCIAGALTIGGVTTAAGGQDLVRGRDPTIALLGAATSFGIATVHFMAAYRAASGSWRSAVSLAALDLALLAGASVYWRPLREGGVAMAAIAATMFAVALVVARSAR